MKAALEEDEQRQGQPALMVIHLDIYLLLKRETVNSRSPQLRQGRLGRVANLQELLTCAVGCWRYPEAIAIPC